MKRIEIEQIRDSVKSLYNVSYDYCDYEQELMKDFEREYITREEFEDKLNELYADMEEDE